MLRLQALTMRALSDDFVEHYVATEWENIRHCVGCYEIEGRGAQLFAQVTGSQFTIMGLPVAPVAGFFEEK